MSAMLFALIFARVHLKFPLNEMHGFSRLCDRLQSSVIIWKQLSLRSYAICDLRSCAIVCVHMETSLYPLHVTVALIVKITPKFSRQQSMLVCYKLKTVLSVWGTSENGITLLQKKSLLLYYLITKIRLGPFKSNTFTEPKVGAISRVSREFLKIISWNYYINCLFGWYKPKFVVPKLIWYDRYILTLALNNLTRTELFTRKRERTKRRILLHGEPYGVPKMKYPSKSFFAQIKCFINMVRH